MDTTTEFEISKTAAESFAVKIRRPDKEDNIRIEPMADGPQMQAPLETRSPPPRHEPRDPDRNTRQNDFSRDARGPKPHKPHGASAPKFVREPGFEKKKHYEKKPAHAGPPPAGASPSQPPFGKKKKKKNRHA
jgi:ATP-dependent RNA helicase DeaD